MKKERNVISRSDNGMMRKKKENMRVQNKETGGEIFREIEDVRYKIEVEEIRENVKRKREARREATRELNVDGTVKENREKGN